MVQTDNDFSVLHPIFRQLFDEDPYLEDYFLSLPEETQQALLREDIQSEKDLRDCVEQNRLKE